MNINGKILPCNNELKSVFSSKRKTINVKTLNLKQLSINQKIVIIFMFIMNINVMTDHGHFFFC